MTGTVGIIGSNDKHIEELVRATGMRPVALQPDQLSGGGRGPVVPPDVILVDVRTDRRLLGVVAGIKRRFPTLGAAIIVPSLDPTLMLEAMRAGVTECITEPITQDALESAIGRVFVQRAGPVEGRVFAIVGAKGGVGATTIAVNMAEAIAQAAGDSLLVDLCFGTGDTAVFLGVEPRFTVLDALDNTHRLDEAFFRGLVVHTRSGLDLLAAPTQIASGQLDPQRTRAVVEFAVRHYRAVVLDVPRTDTSTLDALDTATSIFVVVNHELPSIRSAYRLIARLRQRYGGERLGLLINRAEKQSDISQADIEKACNAKVRHAFPSEYKTAVAAMNHGQPIAQSKGRLAESFQAFARTLNSQDKTADEPAGLFGWMAPRRSTT